MSATVDAQRFSNYLEGAPVLNVPGRTFPVRTKYLEDAIEMSGYELGDGTRQNGNTDPDDFDGDIEDMSGDTKSKADAAKTLKSYSSRTRKTLAVFDEYRIDYDFVSLLLQKIATEKEYIEFSRAILVFLPGIAEIRRMNDMLTGHPLFAKKWYIYPLHSTIASEDQEQAFLTPPRGVRKIVLATNIAETGITIPDVTCVVDTGKHKEMRFDERRQLSRLIEAFISRANAKQRRGRAGRVQEGLCFHLFTKARHDQIMAEQQTPEMLRLSLQDLVLRVKICKLGDIEETLSDALDAPQPKNIRRAIDSLVDVKALTAGEELTPLGRQLAKLPLDVHLGKLILLGCIFGCLDVALTVAAILSSKSPFQASIGSRVQADLARVSFKRGVYFSCQSIEANRNKGTLIF
jgi:ATP-dependent RNA helicase DHX29